MRRPRLAAAAALTALVALSAGLRYAAAHGVQTPWVAPDEMLYALLGRALWSHGSLTVLGGPTPFYSLVYPALAGLPLAHGSIGTGYALLKALQAVAMSLAAVPVYLWGRRLVRPPWALGAAALTLAIPGLAYSGLVMTEVAFYPLLVLAAWAAAAAIERPTLARQALAVALAALAVLTRLQALVLVAAVPTAAVAEALLARRPHRALRLWPLGVVAVAAAAFYAVRGSAGLGGYAAAAGSYGAGDAARYVLYHAAALLLLCGVVPACALALQVVQAASHELPAPARALVAVAASFVVWTVVEVGVFASEHAHRLEERDLLALAPLLFLSLALWLDRGAPRRYALAAPVAFLAAAVLLATPLGRFVNEAGVPDSPTLAAVWRLVRSHPGLSPTLLVAAPATALAATFALLPRRLLPALVALVLGALVAGSAAASLQFRDESAATRARLVGADPRWIDRRADGPTAYLFVGGPHWNAVWANLFWNRRLDRVYDLPGARVPGPMPQRALTLGGDGVLRLGRAPVRERLAVLDVGFAPQGTQLAVEPLTGSDVPALALWRLEPPSRLLTAQSGFQPNGDVYARGSLRAFGCGRGGTFVVTLLGKTTERVAVRLGGRTVQSVPLVAGKARTVLVRARPGRPTCTLELVPTSTLGVTQLAFQRG